MEAYTQHTDNNCEKCKQLKFKNKPDRQRLTNNGRKNKKRLTNNGCKNKNMKIKKKP